jgi:HSP20 family protein
MALVRWTARRPDIYRNEDQFEDPRVEYDRPAYSPRVDMVNNESTIVLKAEVPGVDRENLDITVTSDVVTLKGERKNEETSENECYLCRESRFGTFERVIPLPEPIVSDEVRAVLKNGVLTLTLPKAEPKKAIKIEVD